jgi:hypothetical protein
VIATMSCHTVLYSFQPYWVYRLFAVIDDTSFFNKHHSHNSKMDLAVRMGDRMMRCPSAIKKCNRLTLQTIKKVSRSTELYLQSPISAFLLLTSSFQRCPSLVEGGSNWPLRSEQEVLVGF